MNTSNPSTFLIETIIAIKCIKFLTIIKNNNYYLLIL